MTKATVAKDSEPAPKKRGNRFVPLEDVPSPGLSARSREVLALALCGFSLYAMLCLATFSEAPSGENDIPSAGMQNLGGAFGYYLAYGFARSLGLAGWVPFLLLLGSAMALFIGRQVERLVVKLLGAVVFAAMMAILFAGSDGYAGIRDITPFGAGGVFGAFVSPRLESAFGGPGRLLLVGFGSLVSFLIATEWMFSQLLMRSFATLDSLWRRWRGGPTAVPAGGGDVIELLDEALAPSSRRGTAAREGSAARGAAAANEPAKPADSQGPAQDRPAGVGVEPPPRRRRAVRLREDREDAPADEPGVDEPVEEGTVEGRIGEVEPAPAAAAESTVESAAASGAAVVPAAPVAEPKLPIVVIKPKPKPRPKPKKKAGQNTLPFDEAYPFPPVELFQEAVIADLGATSEVLARSGQAILQKLANFGIEATVVAASVGPAVTQYELRLADSIRVNKVVGFEADLAAVLKAVSVRVVAPIPGKDTIGIEVPNPKRQIVFMRDLLEQFGRAEDLAIPLFLGKDVAGNPIVEDLARMPHLLIAGTTGSGKSVCLNTILLSILMSRTPGQVKLILVDPKMVELQAYKRVPHLCCDVVTNMKKAASVLQWAVDEMENRYALMSVAGVNHIRNYNRLGQQELEKRAQREIDPERVHLPYIVIVIDEFADLMNVAQNEVEELIQRLAQKSRSVGMHVILATQRPSSEVITGIIKANLPCQIAFKVNRKIDSRVILDANGAEKLLGFGDMLYMPPGGGAMMRAQGTFVADDELLAVVKFLEEHGQEPDFNPGLVQTQTSSRPSIADSDERYREAVEIVLGQQRGSATLLQRALAVGYTRATRLLELMEEDGLVGPFVGSKSREVLMTLDEWRAREEQMAEALEAVAEEDSAGEQAGETDDAGEASSEIAAEAAAAEAPAAPGADVVAVDESLPIVVEAPADPDTGVGDDSAADAR